MIVLYHQIGTEISRCVQEQGWGSKVIEAFSKDLRSKFADIRGFSSRNLIYVGKFAESYTEEFVQQAVAQIPQRTTTRQ